MNLLLHYYSFIFIYIHSTPNHYTLLLTIRSFTYTWRSDCCSLFLNKYDWKYFWWLLDRYLWPEKNVTYRNVSRDYYFTFLSRSEEHTSELQSRGHLVC